MTAKSTSNQTSKPKGKSTAKSTAKPAAKAAAKPKAPTKSATKAAKPKAAPSAAAKPPAKTAAKAEPAKAAKPKPSAKPKPPAKAAAKPKAPTKTGAPAPTPLEVVQPLIRVRQMRDFSTKRVSKAEMEAITEVARWSGSSRNEQPCRFIAIRNRELIRTIAELGLPQTRGLPSANAAVAIILPDEPERELPRAFDDGRAAERILIAANLLGLGGGISRVRPDVREGINTALKLPANRSVRTIVAIGHPSADALEPKSKPGKARLPREEVVYEGCWPEPPKPTS